MKVQSRPQHLQNAAAILGGAVLLTWPALLNRYPLLYPDSIGYLQDGRPTAAAIFLHRLAGYTAQRSELYSLGIFVFHWNLTPWPIVALNALLTAYVLYLVTASLQSRNPTQPPATDNRQRTTFLAITAFLSLFTSICWYVSLLMPDILGGLLYLSIYLLVFARETLIRSERIALSVLAVWAITAHSTHLMLTVFLLILLTLIRLGAPRLDSETWVRRVPPISPHVSHWRRGLPQTSFRALAHITLLIAIAATAQITLHAYLYGRPSLGGSRPPYLMARIIADGPGAQYLRQNCPNPLQPAHAWAICASVAHLPDNDDDFLWGTAGIWSSADPQTQRRLLAEEMPLVRATLRAYPRQQLAVSWANFVHQLNDFGVNDFDNNDWMEHSLEGPLPGSHAAYARTLQARSAIPTNRFSILQRWIIIPSAVLLAALLPWLWRNSRANPVCARLLGLTAIVIPTLIANALVTAVLSSSDSRYQARIIWLLPFLAALGIGRRTADGTC